MSHISGRAVKFNFILMFSNLTLNIFKVNIQLRNEQIFNKMHYKHLPTLVT